MSMTLISKLPTESPYALIDIQRERASRSLYTYLKQSWPTMEPGYQFKDNWHIGAICEHLQAVSDGEIKRLIVNIPPRHCKSSIISVAWPTWDWITNPHRQFLFASYAAALSIRDAVKSRRLINSPWYQEHFGGVFSLSDDQNQKTRYSNDKNGYRVATSVGGQLTGDGADFVCCVPRGSVIYSCDGNREMSELVSSKERVRVLGYDHANGVPRWQEIEEYEANPTRRIITVRTRTRSVRCTEDHPIFVIGRGYVPASLVGQGDRIIWAGVPDVRAANKAWTTDVQPRMLGHMEDQDSTGARDATMLDMRSTCISDPSTLGEAERPTLLQQYMHGGRADWGTEPKLGRREGHEVLCEMWDGVPGRSIIGEASDVLLPLLQGKDSLGDGRIQDQIIADRAGMPSVSEGIQAGKQDEGDVFHVLRGEASFQEDERKGERSVCSRASGVSLQRGMDSEDQASDSGERRIQVQAMWGVGGGVRMDPERSSHRLRQAQHGCEQPDISVQEVSWVDARGSEFTCDMGIEVVESVTPDGVTEPTFNIRVVPDHNYFANGILVHNCDDPNSATDVESDAVRESTLEWWDQVIPTRLNDPKTGAFVVIQQRLHQSDITGHILEKETGWDHLVFPARYERSPLHQVKSSLKFKDPRKKEGELLWPSHFGEKEITSLEQRLGSYGTAGQLQQRPAPAGGGLIKREHFKLWPSENGLPQCAFIVQSYDTAFTDKTTGDPTACTTWGVFKPVINASNRDPAPWSVIMLDGWSEHLLYPDLRRKAISEYNTEYGEPPRMPDVVLIEDKGSGQALKVDLARAGVPVRTYNPYKADKAARVHIILPILEAGRVYIPESQFRKGEPCTWAEPLLRECMFFPRAEHDDLVDTMTQCLIMLHDNSFLSIDEDKDDNDEQQTARVNPYAV
jgi:predicted phage terminase large subunit-like protein